MEMPCERTFRCGSAALVSGIPGRNAAQCIFAEQGLVGQEQAHATRRDTGRYCYHK
jgi:hypothetical protein